MAMKVIRIDPAVLREIVTTMIGGPFALVIEPRFNGQCYAHPFRKISHMANIPISRHYAQAMIKSPYCREMDEEEVERDILQRGVVSKSRFYTIDPKGPR